MIFNSDVCDDDNPYEIAANDDDSCSQIRVGFIDVCVISSELIESKEDDVVSCVVEYLM